MTGPEEVTDRLISYLISRLSRVQRDLLLRVSEGSWKSYPGDGVTSATLNALHRMALINRRSWEADMTWLGTLVAVRLRAEEGR